jgi:hypothetical protein
VQEFKEIKIAPAENLSRLEQLPTLKKVIRIFFEEELSILTIVFTTQIWLIFLDKNEKPNQPYQLCLQQSKNNFKFTDAYFNDTEKGKFLLIPTRVDPFLPSHYSRMPVSFVSEWLISCTCSPIRNRRMISCTATVSFNSIKW